MKGLRVSTPTQRRVLLEPVLSTLARTRSLSPERGVCVQISGSAWGQQRLSSSPCGCPPLSVRSATQLQASGLPGSTELTVGAAVACFLALEGADVSYANHRGRSPLDLATEGRVLKALQGCAQHFR